MATAPALRPLWWDWSRGLPPTPPLPCPRTPAPTSSSSALATPGCGPPTTCCATSPSLDVAGARGRARRLRGERAQRRLGLGALAGRAPDPGPRARPRRGPGHAARACATRSTRSGRSSGTRASTAGSAKGGTIVAGPQRGAGHPGAGRGSRRGRRGLTAPSGSTPRRPASGSTPPEVRGATFNPHCARVHPRRLVDGLAAAVRRPRRPHRREHPGDRDRRRGAVPYGRRHAGHAPGTSSGPPRAGRPRLPGQRRAIAPVYSLMVATEPHRRRPLGPDRACRA